MAVTTSASPCSPGRSDQLFAADGCAKKAVAELTRDQ